MHREGIKIPVVMQQLVTTRDAAGSNNSIYGFLHREAQLPKYPKISRGLNGNLFPT
jgi:hypothetical protein